MYPGHINPMGSMQPPVSGGGDEMRGQYHVQQHQHHHHHHHRHHQPLLSGQTQAGSGHGLHVHGHSRHSGQHQHERSRGDRRDIMHYSSPALAIGGEPPYGSHGIQHGSSAGGGGFVMGTDLRTPTPTSGDWYHEQPAVQVQPAMPPMSLPQTSTDTTPKDPESDVFGEVKGERQSVGHKQPVTPLLQEGWKASSVRCTVPKLYQQSSSGKAKPFVMAAKTDASKCLDHPRDKDDNNLVLHCVELQHHIEELKSVISTLPSRPKEMVPSTLLQPSAPPKPTTFYTEPPTKQPHDPLQTSQNKLPKTQLDQTALHLLLRKSTAAICAHAGYEGSSSRALDTLSDVLGNFLSNFSKIMRINADRLCESGLLSFQDVVEQSLHQCGLGGKVELHQYWMGKVKGHMQSLDREVEGHMAEYKSLTNPNSGKQKSSVPSSLPLAKCANKDQELKLPSIWPAATPIDLPGGVLDEELTLDAINLENVLPIKTPDLGGPGMEFTQFSDAAAQESEGFTPLTVDGPPRKRLRTMALEPQMTQHL